MHLNIQNFDMMTGWTLAYAFNLFPLPAEISFDRVGQLISSPEKGAFMLEQEEPWERTLIWLKREGLILFSRLHWDNNRVLTVEGLELTSRSLGVLRFTNDPDMKYPLGNALISACESREAETLTGLSRTFLKHALGFD